MKQLLLSFLLILCCTAISAQQISSAEIQVNGLTCSMCSQATERSLRTLDFVSSVKPDLNKNIFVLSFRKDKKTDIDQLKKKVQDAGFSIGSLNAEFIFSNVKVDENGQAITNGNVYRFVDLKNTTLNGAVKVTVIDRNFIPAPAFKARAAKINSDAYATGTGRVNGKKARIYHLSAS